MIDCRQDVLSILEAFSNQPRAQIAETDTFQADLFLDHNALVMLAMALRGYVKRYGSGTLSVSEISGTKFTVGELVALVCERTGR